MLQSRAGAIGSVAANSRRIPISGWYVWAVAVGLLLFGVGSCGWFFPWLHWRGFKWDLFAVHLVRQDGTPAAGKALFASARPSFGYDPQELGVTGSAGYLYAIIKLNRSGTTSILGRENTTWEQEDEVNVHIPNGEGWRTLGAAKGIQMPPKVRASTPPALLRDGVRQVDRLPPWASDVQILHATIEP